MTDLVTVPRGTTPLAAAVERRFRIRRLIHELRPFTLSDGAVLDILEVWPFMHTPLVRVVQRKRDAVSRVIMDGEPVGSSYTEIEATVELGALVQALDRTWTE